VERDPTARAGDRARAPCDSLARAPRLSACSRLLSSS
jgi:hypothetical protein